MHDTGASPETSGDAAPSTRGDAPDHDKKVAKGLAEIDAVEAVVDAKDHDGKLTKVQAEQVAATVKRNNPIFTKIIVHYEVAKNEINYEWFASNGIRKSNRKPYTDDLEPAANEGTKVNPFPLDWAKPASAEYPAIYIGDRHAKGGMSQAALKSLHEAGKTDNGVAVQKLEPHSSSVLSTGETLGITSPWQLRVGTTIGPLSPDGTQTPGGGSINAILERYGFQSTLDKLQGDHIHEIQLGGQDVLGNLWPLDYKINAGAGSKIDKTDINLRSGKTVKVYQLRQFVKANTTRQIWFKIKSVKASS